MERDTYPRRWGLGPIAQRRKALVAEGKLDKYGRKNDKTPADYLNLIGASNVAAASSKVPSTPSAAVAKVEVDDDDSSEKDKKKKDKKNKKEKRDHGSDDGSEDGGKPAKKKSKHE
jgi:H/ACA ribonucleoprotein complex subunit 4